ncbi:MAG: dihydrofolate reductase family protein [Flavobacteriales bacterium]
MAKTVLYIATSLDGYIARPDGNLDWLTSIPSPQTGDYGYADLLNRIGAIIMGRLTYDEVIGFGGEWPYKGFDTYVVSNNKNLEIKSDDTYLLHGNIKDFVTKLKAKAEKDIWLVGGSQLLTTFINDEILDEMIITIIPKIIGDGIPLFTNKTKETNWKLVDTKSFDTGVVNLTYVK